jgi:hypothetical protein
MAVQAHGKKPGGQINRTPAPKQDLKTGGESYGQANDVDTPAALPPGVGGPRTKLGQNLRDSVDDDVIGRVVAGGIAGRGDQIPADGDYNDAGGQLRRVSSESYPPAHGHVRQQNPDLVFGKAKPSLPAALTDDETDTVRNP